MNRHSLALSLVLVSLITGPTAAQDPAPAQEASRAAPATPARKAANQNVQIDVTITLKHGNKPIVKQLSMVVADGRTALGRAGTEIPVPTTSTHTTPTGPTAVRSFNYRSLGINVDAVPELLEGNKVGVRLKMNFSTVYLPEGPDVPQPSFGTGSSETYLVFDSGKPIVLSHAMDGESGRDYTVEVKATILK
jgi:type II secretory pathway component GspD/PulD (secretin)